MEFGSMQKVKLGLLILNEIYFDNPIFNEIILLYVQQALLVYFYFLNS